MEKPVPLTAEKAAQYRKDIMLFLEDQYIVPETGKLLRLEQWQKDDIFLPLFYDLTPEGLRKYDLALIGMPKKNGKSTIASGIGVYFMFAGETYGEVIIAANNLDQASLIIYNKISRVIQLNPTLKAACNIYKDAIEVKSTGTVCRPVAHKYQTAAGLNPTLVLFDELWGFPSREFYDELTTSPARVNPLNLIVTYAGYDEDSLLYELYKKGMEHKDPNMFFIWLNKNKASWVTEKYLAKQKLRMPENVYARLHENRWAPKSAAFVTDSDLALMHSYPWTMQMGADPEKRNIYVIACDLGLSADRTVRAVVHYDRSVDKVMLDSMRIWEGTRQDKVVISSVKDDLVECGARFKSKILVVDPWQMEAVIQELSGTFSVKPFNFQTEITPMSQQLIQMIRAGKVAAYSEPQLDKELSKLIAKQTSRGWRIEHLRGQHNDCVMALGMGIFVAMKLAYEAPSISSLWLGPQSTSPILSGIREVEF